MNISTIDVSERDIEIRVRHDLDGALGSIIIDKYGVLVDGKRLLWNRQPALSAHVLEIWDSEGLFRSLTAVSRD